MLNKAGSLHTAVLCWEILRQLNPLQPLTHQCGQEMLNKHLTDHKVLLHVCRAGLGSPGSGVMDTCVQVCAGGNSPRWKQRQHVCKTHLCVFAGSRRSGEQAEHYKC